ncbi:MAG TPA: endonuclease/exonuclease/phosphatase family protein [Acidiferrobacterales bacterium]
MHIRIVSYNIHRAIGVDRRFRLERIVRILEHIDADIALLQEVDCGAPRSCELDLGRELAQALGYPHYAIGHNVTLRKGRYGNATLSRFPIRRERNIDLSVDSRKRRGCQHTHIEIESSAGVAHPLEVFNLHLGLSAQERARQVGMLVRSQEFTGLDPAQACLVGGDFNDWRNLLPPIFTEVLGFDCATNRRDDFRRPIRTYPAFSPTGGLDKIFYRGPVRALDARACRLGVSRLASDHLPVIAEFELS